MPRKSKTGRSSSSVTLPKDLGTRLRQSREQKGLTGRGLAQHLGISPSLISQIERGRVVPSVGTLYAITTHLEMGIDDLFREANGHRPDGAVKSGVLKTDAISPVQDGRTRQMIRLAEGIRWERLTAQPDSETEFYYVVYEVGAESCPKDSLIRHGGKEYRLSDSGPPGSHDRVRGISTPAWRFDLVRSSDSSPSVDDRQETGGSHLGRVQPAQRQPQGTRLTH